MPPGVAVDILVNNAGIQFRKPDGRARHSPTGSACSTPTWPAPRSSAREAAEAHDRCGGGKIINIGSLTSRLPAPLLRPIRCRRAASSC